MEKIHCGTTHPRIPNMDFFIVFLFPKSLVSSLLRLLFAARHAWYLGFAEVTGKQNTKHIPQGRETINHPKQNRASYACWASGFQQSNPPAWLPRKSRKDLLPSAILGPSFADTSLETSLLWKKQGDCGGT